MDTTAPPLRLRAATAADKTRMLAIAAQVWDGEDYVSYVLDDWLADPDQLLMVAELEEVLLGFARAAWLLPGYLWLEGARTDPAVRNRGAAQALLRYFLEEARSAEARGVGLSTYIDNNTTQHITARYGFARAAEFVYLESLGDNAARAQAQPAAAVVNVTPAAAATFAQHSAFLRAGQGYFPHGWKFLPFAWNPPAVLARMTRLLGIYRDGDLRALLCAGASLRHQDEFTVDFIDGDPDAVAQLLRHALYLARDCRSVELMVPSGSVALSAAQQLEFTAWNAYQPDVYVYYKPGHDIPAASNSKPPV